MGLRRCRALSAGLPRDWSTWIQVRTTSAPVSNIKVPRSHPEQRLGLLPVLLFVTHFEACVTDYLLQVPADYKHSFISISQVTRLLVGNVQ